MEKEKRSRIPEQIKELRPHATWRLIEWVVGVLVSLVGTSWLLLTLHWIRQNSVVIGLTAFFVVSLALWVISLMLLKKVYRHEQQAVAVDTRDYLEPPNGGAPPVQPSVVKPSTFQGRLLNEAQRAKMAAMAATDSNGNMIAEGDTVRIVGKITEVYGNDPHKGVKVRLNKVNPNQAEGTVLNVYADQVEFGGDNLLQPFSGINILILPGNPGLYVAIFPANPGVHGSPGLWVTYSRSEAEIQITILSTDAIELQYVKAEIIGPNNTNVTTLERNESVVIPAFNPRPETIRRPLTPSELQRFGKDRATWFQVAGFAKFKGPKGQELKMDFEFGTTAWRYGDPKQAKGDSAGS